MSPTPTHTPATRRRDRLRRDTEREIRTAARSLLQREGMAGVTMRAMAAEVGMTAPALYRYYESHEQVLGAVTVDCFEEITEQMTQAAAGATEPGAAMVAACRAFRGWALAHPPEFSLVFAHPMPDLTVGPEGPVEEAGMRFAGAFAAHFRPMWEAYRFPVPEPEELDATLRAELEQHAAVLPGLPVGAVFVFVSCWARLIGVISAEVFGQLHWAAQHTEPFFDDLMADLAQRMRMPASALS